MNHKSVLIVGALPGAPEPTSSNDLQRDKQATNPTPQASLQCAEILPRLVAWMPKHAALEWFKEMPATQKTLNMH
jgi:hypothetical protein